MLHISKTGKESKSRIKSLQTESISTEIINFISKYVNNLENGSVILDTRTRFNIDILNNNVQNIINFHKVNDIRYLNKFFESVNKKLSKGGVFIGCVETYRLRRKRLMKNHHPVIAYPYMIFDFIFRRIPPKISVTQKIYYFFTDGKNRPVSRSETLGRLVSCGFEILGDEQINNLIYFSVKKNSEPKYDDSPSYGLLIKLERIGKEGKRIKVYKFRTMHPYSEYIQEYVYEKYNIKEGGKFDNDFRITSWGKMLRKFWIDEVPMIWNLLKGDLKLFGVRPLSQHYYDLYDEDLRIRRIKYKPGLVPPYYVDLPKTLQEIMESERKYLDSYDKHSFLTDWKYFWKAVYNIVFKHAKSA